MCVSPFLGYYLQWRAPEECPDKFKDNSFSKEPLNEKIDVYGLGNIFYNVLTNADPWMVELGDNFEGKTKITAPVKEFINREKKRGVKPKFTEEVYGLKDPALLAIRHVVEACFERNPEDRPSAHDVVEHFETVIDYIDEFYDTKTGKRRKPASEHLTLDAWVEKEKRFQIEVTTTPVVGTVEIATKTE